MFLRSHGLFNSFIIHLFSVIPPHFLITLGYLYGKHFLYGLVTWHKPVILLLTGSICFMILIGSVLNEWIKKIVQLVKQSGVKKPRAQWKWSVTAARLSLFLIVFFSYYVLSFVFLYRIDGSFPRSAGTTPFCHEHPWNQIYEPLLKIADRNGWEGGGKLMTLPWDDDFHPPYAFENSRMSSCENIFDFFFFSCSKSRVL